VRAVFRPRVRLRPRWRAPLTARAKAWPASAAGELKSPKRSRSVVVNTILDGMFSLDFEGFSWTCKDEVWMTRTLYAACVAGALALAPVAASAQYVTYGAYPYCADPMPRRTRPMPTASTGRRPTPMPIPRPRARPGDTHTGTASTRPGPGKPAPAATPPIGGNGGDAYHPAGH
jgi:hypothetical protein